MNCPKRLQFLFFVLFISFAEQGWAYIPNLKMILSRTAENHGHGIYRIEQEVSFQEGEETFVVREVWLVKDSQQMRLEARGRKKAENLSYTFIYDGQNRYSVDSNGIRKSSRPSDNWFEPYLYFRFQKHIRPRMVSERIIPPDALEEKLPPTDPTKSRIKQDFVRLSRVGGVITYGIGQAPLSADSASRPGLWIEQDIFNVRKIRLPSQYVISADEYSIFANRFALAAKQTVRWDDKLAQIRVISVKSLPNTKEVLKLFEASSLDFGKDPNIASKSSDIGTIDNFYSRFR
ncbi:MAG: hypothetical protein IPJ71_16160 [Bdellovibrionales bacterium]|nr:hypothetical protein [Bdellovibrionales bacterium]